MSTEFKTVLVTGAGSGIGRATALRFLQEGWNLIAVGRRPGPLQTLQNQAPDRVTTAACDLTDAEAVMKTCLQLRQNKKLESLLAVVNNAGTFKRADFSTTADEMWLEQWQSCFLAPTRLSRALLPDLERSGGGSIVHVSSTLGLRPMPGTAAYSAAKAALINLTHTMAWELAAKKIRVNCICPGIVETPIHGFDGSNLQVETEKREQMAKLQPLGRLGRPDEIANAIYFLCSHESSWTTGSVITVDGGINLV